MMLSNGKVAKMPIKKLTDNEIAKAVKSYEEKILANGIKSLEPFEVREIVERQQEEINRKKAEIKEWKRVVETWVEQHEKDKAEIEELQTLVNEMGDYFPACIGCEGKTTLGERTDKCVYEIDNTNYCTKRGITNIVSFRNENRELKTEIERLKKFALIRNFDRFEKEIKTEAYREFAERTKELIKKYSVGNGLTQLRNSHVDNLLKELVGEDG